MFLVPIPGAGHLHIPTRWFVSQVKPNAPYDVKVDKVWEALFKGEIKYYSQQFKFIYDGYIITSEDLGNIIFGYMGSAIGFSRSTLFYGADLVATVGKSIETKRDQDMTDRGIDKFFAKYSSKTYPPKV